MFRSDTSTSLMKLGLTALILSTTHAFIASPVGSAFSLDVLAPLTPQPFSPTAEHHRLSSKYPTTSYLSTRELDPTKQQGSVLVPAGEGSLSFFVATVIGNQTFSLLYDTGSANLWVYSNESSIYQSEDHPTYVPTSSATLLQNYTWAIRYVQGASSLYGIVFTDFVKAGPVIAQNQAVQAATFIKDEFTYDGIMGLASSTINTVKPVKQKTFFETLGPTLQRNVFASNLRAEGNGSWDFGYIDQSKFSGDITWAPVINGSAWKYWAVSVGTYAVGEKSFGQQTVGDVIVDSGTSLVYLPDEVVDEYYSEIVGHVFTVGGTHTFPCNSTIPDFHFKVEGGNVLTIPGKYVNYAVYDEAKNTCVGGISSLLNKRYSILGTLFMKNYYIIHSKEEEAPKMGFASH
ncbi:related to aspartic proteinase precursor [Rhynchosporium secalis]|uniref:Related to aspartic proteinase n=1 Tax=Rhynchosporium secalis TaxID=38038 RepID=A0A1E1MR34_RHYSE|nr:related to aspartic proteinase precursor [Rhynchosporium secalis]